MGMVLTLVRVPEAAAWEMLTVPEEVYDLLQNPFYPEIDIDKAWKPLHRLLTGEAWGGEGPLAFLLIGGRSIGSDFGYGPGRVFFADEVAAIQGALALVPESLLAAEGLDGDPDYLRHHFVALRTFVADSTGHALVLYLS